MKTWILIAALGLAGCSNAMWGVYEPESWAYYCADEYGLTPGDANHTECMNHYYGQWARLLDSSDALRAFLEENKSKLKLKDTTS